MSRNPDQRHGGCMFVADSRGRRKEQLFIHRRKQNCEHVPQRFGLPRQCVGVEGGGQFFAGGVRFRPRVAPEGDSRRGVVSL